MIPAPAIAKALRARATTATGLNEPEAARLLRGYATTIDRDPGAVVRVRGRVEESAALVDEAPVTPIVQVWRDALVDLGGVLPRRAAAPPKPKAKAKAPAAQPAAPEPAIRVEDPAIAVLRAEIAGLRDVLALTERTLLARIATLEEEAAARRAPAPSLVDGLGARPLPGGRTWLELVEEIAAEHGVTAEEIVGPGKHDVVAAARHHVWWWLHRRAQASYSPTYIGAAFGRDVTTVASGIRRHEGHLAAAVAPPPPSGPRLRAPIARPQPIPVEVANR